MTMQNLFTFNMTYILYMYKFYCMQIVNKICAARKLSLFNEEIKYQFYILSLFDDKFYSTLN